MSSVGIQLIPRSLFACSVTSSSLASPTSRHKRMQLSFKFSGKEHTYPGRRTYSLTVCQASRGTGKGRSGKSNSGPGSKRSQDTHQPLEPPDLGDVFDGIDTVTTDRQRRERSQINNSQPADPWQPPIFDRPDSDSLLPDIDPDIEDFLEEEEDEEGVDDGQADRRWNPQGWEERYADAEYYEELERGLADGTYVEIDDFDPRSETQSSSNSTRQSQQTQPFSREKIAAKTAGDEHRQEDAETATLRARAGWLPLPTFLPRPGGQPYHDPRDTFVTIFWHLNLDADEDRDLVMLSPRSNHQHHPSSSQLQQPQGRQPPSTPDKSGQTHRSRSGSADGHSRQAVSGSDHDSAAAAQEQQGIRGRRKGGGGGRVESLTGSETAASAEEFGVSDSAQGTLWAIQELVQLVGEYGQQVQVIVFGTRRDLGVPVMVHDPLEGAGQGRGRNGAALRLPLSSTLDLLHMSSISVALPRPEAESNVSTSNSSTFVSDTSINNLYGSEPGPSVSAKMARHMRAWSSAVAASRGSRAADQTSSSGSSGYASDPGGKRDRVKRVGDSWTWPAVEAPEHPQVGSGLATRGVPSHLLGMVEILGSRPEGSEVQGLEGEGAEQTATSPPLPAEWMAILVGGDSSVVAALDECRGRGVRTGVVVAGYHHPQPAIAVLEDNQIQLSRESRVELCAQGWPLFRYGASLAGKRNKLPRQEVQGPSDPQQNLGLDPSVKISSRDLDPVPWQVRDASEVVLHWECVCEGAYDVARGVAWGGEAVGTELSSAFPGPRSGEPWSLGMQVDRALIAERISAERVRACASDPWASLQVVPCSPNNFPTQNSPSPTPVTAPAPPTKMYVIQRKKSVVRTVRQAGKHVGLSQGESMSKNPSPAAVPTHPQRVKGSGLGEMRVEDMEREFEAYLKVLLK